MSRRSSGNTPPGLKAQTVADERIRDLNHGYAYTYIACHKLQNQNSKLTIQIKRPEGRYETKFLSSSKANGLCMFSVYSEPDIIQDGVWPLEPTPYSRTAGADPFSSIQVLLDPEWDDQTGIHVVEHNVERSMTALSGSWEDRAILYKGSLPGNSILHWKNLTEDLIYLNVAFSWCEHAV